MARGLNIMGPINRDLLLGIAVILLTVSPTQAAEKLRLGLEGEYVQYFGYANNDDDGTGDFTGFDVKADSEIAFAGETTLDNGLRFGVEVVLKAETAGSDQIDGTYLWNEGDHGRIEIGQADNTAVVMHLTAPDVGFGVNDTDISDWITNPSGGDADSGFRSTYLYLGDDQATKLSWYSPPGAGFRVGVSYIPEFERDDNSQPNGDKAYRDAISVGISYDRRINDDVHLGLSAGFLSADGPKTIAGGSNAEGYSLGFNVKIKDFTIGGSYASTNGNPSEGEDITKSLDGSGFDIGVSYAFARTSISLVYYQGEVEDDVATSGESTHRSVMASIRYHIGPGVTAIGSLLHSRFEADTNVKNEGTAFIGGLVLEF